MGKSTEETAMELDGEGATNFEQLEDLIQKECDKRDRKYPRLEEKCNKLEQQVTKKDKKHVTEGPTTKQRRVRRLEEKQIQQKASSKPNKHLPKKRPSQQPWTAKLTRTPILYINVTHVSSSEEPSRVHYAIYCTTRKEHQK